MRHDLVHTALVYSSDEGFLGVTVPFLREGIARGERTLVVARRANTDLLRDALGDDARHVDLREPGTFATTPWRALRAYRRFAGKGSVPRVRVVGEPLAPVLTPGAVVEWTRYESISNLALADVPLTALCPYDTRRLPPFVVDHAVRTHPVVLDEAGTPANGAFVDPRVLSRELDRRALEPPREPVAELPLSRDLDGVRQFVSEQARRAGVEPGKRSDLTLAAHEIATNARLHGGGSGAVRTWVTDGELVCEVSDHGSGMDDPLAGYAEPPLHEPGGRGLWLARQLCDLVQVRTGPHGTIVRLHAARP